MTPEGPLPRHGPPASPAPPASVWLADPDWRCVDFVSDLHLCPGMPRTLDAFADYLANTPAGAVGILGDLFEVWVGDDVVRDPFLDRCIGLFRAASERLHLAFMQGNRDFLLGKRMLAECGMQALADPTVLVAWQRRTLLSHGDALCLGDQPYQAFRSEVRTAEWQQAFLALPLAERIRQARAIRDHSEARQRGDPMSVDADPAACRQWLRDLDAAVLVHGHTHRPADHALGPGLMRLVLPDWDVDDSQRRRGGVLRLDAEGFHRVPISALPTPMG